MESHAAGTYQWSGRSSVAGVFACAHPLLKLSPPFLSLSESLDEIRSRVRTPWRAPGDGSSSSFSRSFPPDSIRQTLAYPKGDRPPNAHNATATTSTRIKTPAGQEESRNSERPISAKTMGNERLDFSCRTSNGLSFTCSARQFGLDNCWNVSRANLKASGSTCTDP